MMDFGVKLMNHGGELKLIVALLGNQQRSVLFKYDSDSSYSSEKVITVFPVPQVLGF